MPVSALLTLAFYRRRQPFYVAHLYYAVHVHSYAFLAGSIVLLLSRAGPVVELAVMPVVLSIFVYHFLALRRFFGESWPRTLWKGTVLTLMYLILLAAAMGLLLWFAVRGSPAIEELSTKTGLTPEGARPAAETFERRPV
jgi:hypothetical protein